MSQNVGTWQKQSRNPTRACLPPTRVAVRETIPKEFVFRLPVEVLRTIFEEYLRLDLPVQVLLEVNRQWRTVALETQSLWRRLLLSADALPGSLRAGSVHACASEGQTTRILERSGTITNLEVNFVLGPVEGDMATPETRASLFKTVGHTALQRISFLSIIVNPDMTLPLIAASLDNVFHGGLPCLESLMIASAQAIGNLYEPLSVLMDTIEATSDKLKSLYLENVNKDFILRASTKKFWTRLIRITIRNEFDSLDAELFSLPPSLESLSFSGELVATPAPFTAHLDSALKTRIEFPELKWLRVSRISMGTLARLKLPKLHTMAIDCVQGNYPAPAPPLGTLLLPALKVLQIATMNPTIACINAPNLETLCLSIPALKQADADHVLKAVFHGGEAMMRPKHLTLRGPLHDKHLIAALKLLGEKLVGLELDTQMPFSKTFWQEMTPSAMTRRGFRAAVESIITSVTVGVNANVGGATTGRVRGGGGRRYKPLLLPKLGCLVVDVHKHSMTPGEVTDMRIMLKKLIEGRKGSDQCGSLLSLGCRWPEAPGVEEIVDPPTCRGSAGHSSMLPTNVMEVCGESVYPTLRNRCETERNEDTLEGFGMEDLRQESLATYAAEPPAIATIVEAPDLSGQVAILDRRAVSDGNYSKVFLGIFECRKVAVKKLCPLKSARIMRRKFRRELLLSWRLRHRNVMSLDGYFYEYDDKGEVYYSLVSKWAEQGSAADYIYSRHLKLNAKLNLVHDVADGLAYLHSFIVHGDLKPGNVLIDERGTAQICDFGLSRLMHDYEGTPLDTTTDHTGTVSFLSWELVASKKAVPTRATDMYALGCLTHEFIYLVRPHAALDQGWRISQAIFAGIPPATRPAYPEDVPILWDVLECCWSTDARDRPTAVGFFEYLHANQEAMEDALSIIYGPHGPTRAGTR